jgi:hypothetical protein
VPGFAVVLEAGAGAASGGVEAEALAGREGLDGEDVPGVEGSDEGDEDVDVVGGVDVFAFAVDAVDGLDVVSAGAEDLGALELDAPETLAVVEDEVVALAVAPGSGDSETELGDFVEEGGFG